MIPKKDSKPILVKFVVGNTTDSSPKPIYSEWNIISGLISDPNGYIVDNPYGMQQEYDRIIILNATDTSRQIINSTAILIDEYPTDNFKQGNYQIKRIFPEYNREIQIGLSKIEGINIPQIYFEKDGKILSYQLNYSNITNKGYIDRNRSIPFGTDTKMWKRKPTSVDQVEYRIVYKGQVQVGVDDMHLYFKELTFGEYNG